jgi:hypothetical protein
MPTEKLVPNTGDMEFPIQVNIAEKSMPIIR